MFAPFSLPSNPDQKTIIREATTAETLDFCDVMIDHEEALTTKFLNTVQDKASYTDCAKWTAQDRRLALFWYWIHTTEDTHVDLDYTCPHCQKTHNHQFDMRDLASDYQEIQGKAERDLKFNSRRLLVTPLKGHHMETLENMRLGLSVHKTDSSHYLRLKADICVQTLLFEISFTDDHEDDEGKRISSINNWVRELSETKFHELQEKVSALQDEMIHGLPSTIRDGKIMLKSPKHICPNTKDKEVTTELLLPFRDYMRIPRI